MDDKQKRRWRIVAKCRTAQNALLRIEVEVTARDAGAAWLDFSRQFEGASWYGICVTEVRRNE